MKPTRDFNDHPLYRLLRRHFISIGGLTRSRLDPDAAWQPFEVSGFVISVHGMWFFVTAGHVLDTIEEVRKDQEFSGWYFDDSGAYGGEHHTSIPFDFDGSQKFSLVDLADGYDYGFLYLRPYYVNLLSGNGILAADENHWNNVPEECDWYALVGIPEHSVRLVHSGDTLGILKQPVYVQLKRMANPPPEIVKPRPMFYGELPSVEEAPIEDIKGMSGGPIFGFKHQPDGLRYWILAAQSVWYARRRITIGCFVKELVTALKSGFDEMLVEAAGSLSSEQS